MECTIKSIKAIVVYVNFDRAIDLERDLSEFKDLVLSAEINGSAEIICRRGSPDSKFFIGPGKVNELKSLVDFHRVDVVVFNHPLSPAQERNLEQVLKCTILDRSKLILNIFAKRARSFEGKLQVELARLEHMATRLVRGWTHLERQRGGIGLRGGPGEKQLEVDRRILRQKINSLKKRLAKLEKQRGQNRKARKRSGIPVLALVGYTNAGKSTLFRKLSSEKTDVADMVFTTLDPLLRRIYIPDFGIVIIADTVGFIRDLPHELVDAFHATLEEIKEADLLLHMIDASDPEKNKKVEIVNKVLNKIGANKIPQLQVLNKIDLLEHFEPRIDHDQDGEPERVWISAANSVGMDLLTEAISQCSIVG